MLTRGLRDVLPRNVAAPLLGGQLSIGERAEPPLPFRAINKAPWLRRVPAYFLAYGAMRERPPSAALR